jgi:hypothetical protein
LESYKYVDIKQLTHATTNESKKKSKRKLGNIWSQVKMKTQHTNMYRICKNTPKKDFYSTYCLHYKRRKSSNKQHNFTTIKKLDNEQQTKP